MSRHDARRIAEEVSLVLKAVPLDNDYVYRERMLTAITRLEVKVDLLKESFDNHVDEDDRRFTTVNQVIGSNSSWIYKGLGMVAALVFMAGVTMWIVDHAVKDPPAREVGSQ